MSLCSNDYVRVKKKTLAYCEDIKFRKPVGVGEYEKQTTNSWLPGYKFSLCRFFTLSKGKSIKCFKSRIGLSYFNNVVPWSRTGKGLGLRISKNLSFGIE